MEFFVIKTSCRFQQHIYQEQSILRYISSLEPRMLLSGNSILLFFIKLLKNLENQTQISSLLKLISNWIDMCLGIQNQKQWLSLPSLLLGSLVSWILVKIHRDKTNAVIAVPEWSTQYSAYPAVATDDQPEPIVFSWDKHVGLNKEHLIITLKKPFKGVSIDTMRSWVKNIFILNSWFFFSHICWAASTSKAKNMEVNIDEILKPDRWKNRKNLFIFYDKVITTYAPDDIDFNRICQV